MKCSCSRRGLHRLIQEAVLEAQSYSMKLSVKVNSPCVHQHMLRYRNIHIPLLSSVRLVFHLLLRVVLRPFLLLLSLHLHLHSRPLNNGWHFVPLRCRLRLLSPFPALLRTEGENKTVPRWERGRQPWKEAVVMMKFRRQTTTELLLGDSIHMAQTGTKEIRWHGLEKTGERIQISSRISSFFILGGEAEREKGRPTYVHPSLLIVGK